MKIYKYPFELNSEVKINMPEGARVLTVQVQHGSPCLWALVDPTRPFETRTFRIFGTGHEIEDNLTLDWYIGTFQLNDGNFIGHVFQV